MRHRTALAFTLVLVLVALSSPGATGPTAREVRVRMSDGVELAAHLYLPTGEGPFPAVLVRTPYSREGLGVVAAPFVAAGYAVVVQDVRGKYDSGGDFVPFVHELEDGLATLDWIADADWSDGRVAMWGVSYLGVCGLLAAWEGHPALRAVFSVSGWVDGQGIGAPGGANHIMLSIPWILFEGGRSQRSLKHFDLDELFRHLPLQDVFDVAGVEVPAWVEEGPPGPPLRSPRPRGGVPIFHVTGWYDFVAPGSLAAWRSSSAVSGAPQLLMVGPWIHDQMLGEDPWVGEVDAGPDSVLGLDALMALAVDWFDVHLRGARGVPRPPVEVFFLGENRWRGFDSWPPPQVRTLPLRLVSGGRAGERLDDGRLVAGGSERSPAGRDRFTFDPSQPVPTRGGASFHLMPGLGVRDQNGIEERRDVLVYTTAPLVDDLVLAGPVRVVLHVSTEGRDTDFVARLVRVTPEGRAFNVVDGILRLSHRHGGRRELVEPGRVYEVAIDLGEIAQRIPRGHRLRLQVTSSNFPKFDRNPNTGVDPQLATDLRVVRQTLHHSRRHPSRVELTILEGDGR